MEDKRHPIWEPSSIRASESQMFKFLNETSAKRSISPDWSSLYRWSVEHKEEFWEDLAEYTKIVWHRRPSGILKGSNFKDSQWFVDGTLNFAENLLLPIKNNPEEVLIAFADGSPRRSWTGKQLWNDVARVAIWLKNQGVSAGDRVAGVLVNGPEAVIAMLATTSLGAIWSSSSPDFGSSGILDRFSQIEPKVIFFSSSYFYGDKFIDCHDVMETVKKALPDLKVMVPVDHLSHQIGRTTDFAAIIRNGDVMPDSSGFCPIEFVSRKFSDPVYILYSSGTTGKPKCIVHGVGGTLLQHKKELILHSDLRKNDLLFYFTTCGWMMWNWMVSGLSVGARIMTFDGSVGQQDFAILWNLVAKEKVNIFGTSPKFIASCMKANVHSPVGLNALKTILATGSPLLEEHFDWVYSNVKKDVHLASISGGTDIISCFMLGNPLLAVFTGQIQSPGLGMAIEAWDESGEAVKMGEKGELVCTQAFPSMPVGFWNDQDNTAYHGSYFNFYKTKTVWRHGDWISFTAEGGVIVSGRSDTTLNPGGVRIGTAEIYRQVELVPEVMDSLVVGIPQNGDVAVTLFVKLGQGADLESVAKDLKTRIRRELTPRHVPSYIFQVRDIPYTRSGKKVELAVLNAVQGRRVENITALANPECLDEYFGLRDRLLKP